jgi:hypothetical protein
MRASLRRLRVQLCYGESSGGRLRRADSQGREAELSSGQALRQFEFVCDQSQDRKSARG